MRLNNLWVRIVGVVRSLVTLISWDRPTNVIIAERQSGSCKANYLIISTPETVAGLCLHRTYVPLSFNTPNVTILEEEEW